MHGCVSIWSQLILILVWSRLCNDPEKYFFESFIKIFWKGKYDITVHTQWVISREPHIITFPEKNRFWKFWILNAKNLSSVFASVLFKKKSLRIFKKLFPVCTVQYHTPNRSFTWGCRELIHTSKSHKINCNRLYLENLTFLIYFQSCLTW